MRFSNNLEAGFSNNPKGFFFHSEAFLASRESPLFRVFCYPTAENPIIKSIFYHSNNSAKSPWQAGFGGFEMAESVSEGDILNALSEVEDWAKELDLSEIRITDYPNCYDLRIGMVRNIILAQGYQTQFIDINFHLVLKAPLPQSTETQFVKGLSSSKRWRLNNCLKLGFTARINHEPNLEFTYQYILQSRVKKGFVLGQTEKSFLEMFEKMPSKYTVFEVLSPEGEVAAIGVGIGLSDKVYYLFYTADTPKFARFSPVLLLHRLVYEYAPGKGYEILDLGTASLHGEINKGVAAFKAEMGAIKTEKYSFLKKIPPIKSGIA